ncbi:hypothetical protein ACFL2K_03270 [Candidatus Margulisiibacteriota bacterium]
MIAKYLRYISRSVLIIIAVFWFVFALLSGSEELGGGVKGILLNSPNSLPWLLLLLIIYVVWKWEFIGGILIILSGIFTIFFFQTYKSIITFSLISIPLIAIGIMLILSWKLGKSEKINDK